MGIDKVKNFFEEKGIECNMVLSEESTATAHEAAAAMGVSVSQIAKTIACDVREKVVLIVAGGDSRIDTKKFRAVFEKRPVLLKPEEVYRVTGYAIGGVCPFGVENSLDIYMDVNLKSHEFIYPGAGKSNAMIKITPRQLQEITGAEWIDVAK
ncbi:Cys-tRNA(Pro) deacylase [Peptoclostridium litorale DSM 5388]|uniref:Putative YbaK/ebsC protein n=1 Tax=Peptoclostridium litorale DSM 5388 TaxID=1121324 RepID=A0A069RB15_PEPLI|nr:YbaK/EbsC family protein [Peptoclostridium litorale]KDR94221.1 putative YbaK/ebsC protein [Peptoclostridium litorale DSM 5388]SIN82492.1 Cys-tRNA(Pro) deacylase [Peptoclostridium litorale DSM 5388]